MNGSEPTLFSAAWRHRWLVVVITALFLTVGVLFVLLRPDDQVFTADATLLLSEPVSTDEAAVGQNSSAAFVGSQLEIMRSSVVAEEAAVIAEESGLEVTGDDVSEAVTVIGDDESPLVGIQARSDSPETAVLLANSMAEGYRQVSQRQATATSEAQLTRIDAQIESINERLTEIDAQLSSIIEEDEGLALLREQAQEAVSRIADLQAELETADGGDSEAIRQDIEDYRRAITVYSEVLSASAVSPDQRALVEEQSRLVDRRAALQTLRDEIAVDAGLVPDAVALVQPATVAEGQSGLGLSRVLAVALVMGLGAGMGLAYFLSVLRRTFTNRAEPETVLGAPMLADVPDFRSEDLESVVPVRDHPRSASAEAYRFASSSTEAAARGRGLRSIFIASPTLGHGKTTTAVNIAIAAAVHGRSVLLVDGDFGNQEASRLLLGETRAQLTGITDVIEGVVGHAEATHPVELGNGVVLKLMPRGTRPSLAATALQSASARELFDDLTTAHDLVFVDGPPLLQVAYASTLAELADSLLVVVEHQGSYSEMVDLTDRIELIGTPVMGYVYNRSPLRREMTMSEGSMMDILGDGVVPEPVGSTRPERRD